MSGARLAVKVVVSLSFLRDLHPLYSHQLAWRTTILPSTGIDPLMLTLAVHVKRFAHELSVYIDLNMAIQLSCR